MARLVGPVEASRLSCVTTAINALTAAGTPFNPEALVATVYADAACTTLADILTTSGGLVYRSRLAIDSDWKLPQFQFPDGVSVVYTRINGALPTPLYAQASDPTQLTLIGKATPWIISHRGGSTMCAEETYEGYAASVAAGNDFMEMDCQLLADGSLGLMHDSTVDRTTSSSGNCSDQTAASWGKLVADAGSWLGGGWGNCTPATWDGVVQRYGGRVILVPEAKSGGSGAPLAASIVRYGLQKSVLVQSFIQAELTPALAAGCECIFLTPGPGEPSYASLVAAGIRYIGFDTTQAAWIPNAIAAGLKPIVYTLTRRSDRDTYVGMGCVGVFADEPQYLRTNVALRTTDPFASQMWYPGMIPGTGKLRGAFASPNWWGYTTGATDFNLMGWAGPLADPPLTITWTTRIDTVSGGDMTRWSSLMLATDDGDYVDTTSTPRNGYHFLMRANGQLQAYRVTGGVATSLGTATTGAVTLGATEVQLKATITSTTVKFERLDDPGAVGPVTESQYRVRYPHLGHNGAIAYFKAITFA